MQVVETEGYCYFDTYDLEPAEMWTRKEVTTRKGYRCAECGDDIPKGSRSIAETFLGDGAWFSSHTCMPCEQIRKDYDCTNVTAGMLRDHIWDCLGVPL